MNTTPSGLQFEDTVEGDGKQAAAGHDVTVHYTGWLWVDGAKAAKFDSSLDRRDPFEFELGAGMVIRGWDEGVQGMKVGGTRKLIIGMPRREKVGTPDEKAFNSLAVIDRNSALRGPLDIYDKHMLVPFGEFMPFAGVLKTIGLKTLQDLAPGGFDAGPMPATVRVPVRP